MNGKYREQLGLLSELSKEKASDYVAENRDAFEDAKEELEKIRTYTVDRIASWSNRAPKTEDQQALLDFINSYSELFNITAEGSGNYGAEHFNVRNLVIKADVEKADEIMRQFYGDLDQFGKDNNIDVSDILEGISKQLKKTTADEFKEYREIYDEFMKAEVVRNDTLRPLYQQSIQAVEDYNNALSSGEGVAEAKENLDAVQQSVQNATGELEGSQEVFDGIYDGINKNAESAYNLSQAFENDETVKGYAEQLKGLTDIDLKAIDFEDEVQSPGEEAFGALIDTLGLSEEEVQNLIDKLVELGYVQGEVQGSTPDDKPKNLLSISETVDQINIQLKPALDSLKSAYQDIFTIDEGTGEKLFSLDDVDISTFESIRAELEKLDEIEGISVDYSPFERFVSVLSDTSSTADEVQARFDNLATSIIYTTDCTNMSAETYNLLVKSLTEMGVTNADKVLSNLRDIQEELVSIGYDVANITAGEAAELINLGSVSAETAEYLRLYFVQKELAQNPLNTTADIQALEDLCNTLGITGELYECVIALKKAFDAKERGAVSAGLDESIQYYQGRIAELANGQTDFRFNFSSPNAAKSASKAGKESADAYIDAFEEELKALDDLRDNGLISEKEYLDRLRVLYERYFKDKLGYEKEFAKYQKQYLDGYKSLYESIFSHASELISDRIDLLEDEKDAAIDAFEEQKKAAEDSYNAQIKLLEDKKDALQDEIDKIKEANEDREESISLQEKERELARAQNQKTILQYTKDRGFIYTIDEDAIRDAQNELDSAKADAQIRALEKQQDALDKQIDAIQEMIDASNEYWDTQIEQVENYYDTMIKGLEEYKSRWEELSDLQEHAEMIALLKELGLTEEDLLNESSGAFDRLRTSYLGILKDLNEGNQGVLDGLSQLANIDMSAIPGFLEQTKEYADSIANMDVTALSDGLNDVSDGFSNIADSASNAASAISGGGASTTGQGGQTTEKGSQGNANNTGSGSSLKGAIEEVSTDSVQEIDKISDAFAGEDENGTSVTGAIQKVNDKVKNDDDSLASVLFEQTKDALDEENGIPAQKTAWEEMNGALETAVDYITTLQSTLTDMNGEEFTITLKVADNGAALVGAIAGKYVVSGNGGQGRTSGTAHVEGTANVQGNWGSKEGGRTLVGELGQELWVHSADGTFETVGDNGAEFIDIKPNDIIFNHLQTKQLLDKGNIVGRGKAYANGTALVNGDLPDGTIITPDGHVLRPIQPGDRAWELQKAFEPMLNKWRENNEILSNAYFEHQKHMEQMVKEITNNTAINNIANNNRSQVINQEIHVTLPNVTNSTSADALLKDLQSISYKKYQAFI